MSESIESIEGYLSAVFRSDLGEFVDDFERVMKHNSVDYDTIVGTGLSGALIVPILGRITGKHWGIVRKDDSSHSDNRYEGTLGRRWLFVDDQISSGRTIERVCDRISEYVEKRNAWLTGGNFSAFSTECVGAYLYISPRFLPARTIVSSWGLKIRAEDVS